MRIVLAGGTGFIGGALTEALLARGDAVVLLARDAPAARERWDGRVETAAWDGKTTGEWAKAIDGADAVVNLAGESVAAKRWTAERKLLLMRSRIDSTRALVAAISQAAQRPKTLLSASAVGYYGGAPEGEAAESAPQGRDFLAALCGQWEREALAAEPLGARVVLLRIGVVLAGGGGALAKMTPPFKLCVGGPLGGGGQPFPWIHRDDVAGAILFLIGREDVSGPVNLVAPDPKTNAEFSAALGRALRRPSWLPAPAVVLRLLLGEMSEMLLGGQRAVPRKLLSAGYAFKHPDAADALNAIFRGR